MSVEIARSHDGAAQNFLSGTQREALRSLYGFSVIWHEQHEYFVARDGSLIVGATAMKIAASVAYIDALTVDRQHRRRGFGKALLCAAEEVANYYNCHKVSIVVPARSPAKIFFERCGYREEATLAQHAFKLDAAVLRKFLL
ncbi:MAG: GNAT family N-acetyltransferase [Candidatus Eremiobacteraeota bacterium]|nr:GNAT family N-acetyltransferase [Candidatus Eremiobacteraeota bacterium]